MCVNFPFCLSLNSECSSTCCDGLIALILSAQNRQRNYLCSHHYDSIKTWDSKEKVIIIFPLLHDFTLFVFFNLNIEQSLLDFDVNGICKISWKKQPVWTISFVLRCILGESVYWCVSQDLADELQSPPVMCVNGPEDKLFRSQSADITLSSEKERIKKMLSEG